MGFQDKNKEIHWRVHFSSNIEKVYNALTTAEGRESFWAESAKETDGFIEFNILNYPTYQSKILKKEFPNLFSLEYFGTEVSFALSTTGGGGTDLYLLAKVLDEALRQEMIAGWVSVLMAMKGAVDFGIDLRNHSIERTWDSGYVNN